MILPFLLYSVTVAVLAIGVSGLVMLVRSEIAWRKLWRVFDEAGARAAAQETTHPTHPTHPTYQQAA